MNQLSRLEEKGYTPSKLARKAWMLLEESVNALHKFASAELSEDGITCEQALVLVFLHYLGSQLSARQLVYYLQRESPSISGLLSRMEQSNYIRRSRNSKDKRIKRIELTEKGKEFIYHQLLKTPDLAQRAMFIFSESELEQFAEYLERLHNHLSGAAGLETGKGIPWLELEEVIKGTSCFSNSNQVLSPKLRQHNNKTSRFVPQI